MTITTTPNEDNITIINSLLSKLNAGTDNDPYSGLKAGENEEGQVTVFDDYTSIIVNCIQTIANLEKATPINWEVEAEEKTNAVFNPIWDCIVEI